MPLTKPVRLPICLALLSEVAYAAGHPAQRRLGMHRTLVLARLLIEGRTVQGHVLQSCCTAVTSKRCCSTQSTPSALLRPWATLVWQEPVWSAARDGRVAQEAYRAACCGATAAASCLTLPLEAVPHLQAASFAVGSQ